MSLMQGWSGLWSGLWSGVTSVVARVGERGSAWPVVAVAVLAVVITVMALRAGGAED